VVAETKGDVQEGIDTAFYAATEGAASLDVSCRPSCAINGHELSPADRDRGTDHAVQLPARDSDLEDVSGAAV